MITETQKKILDEFKEYHLWEPDEDDGLPQEYSLHVDEVPGVGYKGLEKVTGLSKDRLLPEMIELRNEGFIALQVVVDYEYYMPCGSSYFLTKKGCAFINKHFPYKKHE